MALQPVFRPALNRSRPNHGKLSWSKRTSTPLRTCRDRQRQQAAKRLSQQVDGAGGGAGGHLVFQVLHHNVHHALEGCAVLRKVEGGVRTLRWETAEAAKPWVKKWHHSNNRP